MKRCKVTFQPVNQEIHVSPGITVKDAINLAGFEFDFPCGGRGKCGKCRLQIPKGAVAPTPAEQEHLDDASLGKGFRLACMARITGDTVVELPYVTTPKHQILITATERRIKLEPYLKKTYLELQPPDLQRQEPDWEHLHASTEQAGLTAGDKPDLELLRALPQALREANWRLTVLTDQEKIFGVEPLDTTDKLLGIAFDIGTTTVVGYLLDLRTGQELAAVSALNPQTRHGADVITRISFAAREESGLAKLHEAIISELNNLIGEAVGQAGVQREDIYTASVVGNTTMHHLFLGINPRNLALAPYIPVLQQPIALTARELGLQVNPAGMVYVLPNIAGYVGADTVGVLLATGLDWSEGIKLAIDIGTNGEIVLGSKERLVACSTAAGPAFEGSQISSGMRGTIGAIDHIRFDDGLEFTVIGGGRAQGVCGSGLLDAVAGLLQQGVMDFRGRILTPDQLAAEAGRYADRSVTLEAGVRAFVLATAPETVDGRPILITQGDIRELQLAKGAIAAGIQVLLERLGCDLDEVTEVLLAGAFGNYLDPHSACAIGLIPQSLESRVRPVGNAAGAGAKAALLSRSEYQRAAMIADFTEYIELSAYPNFSHLFTSCLNFPFR